MLICHKNRNKIHKTAISRPFFFKYRLFLYEPNDFPIPFCKKICMYSLYHSRKLVEFPKNMRETVGNFHASTKSFKRIFVSKTIFLKSKKSVSILPDSNGLFFKNTLSPSRVTLYKNHILIHVRVNCNIFV